MPEVPAIALVGDYSPQVIAHRAIPLALELARAATGRSLTWSWRPTREIRGPDDLKDFSAVWVVPASPYANMDGALAAIRHARENQKPLFGSCGGFQHMLIEFARNVAGLTAADHAETNPEADTLAVTPLSCSLVGKSGVVQLTPGSLLQRAYGRDSAQEGYHCNYGLNPVHRAALERAGLRFTAFDDAHEVRAAELPGEIHPFCAGTLFQPERAALRGELPPLVAAFVRAIG